MVDGGRGAAQAGSFCRKAPQKSCGAPMHGRTKPAPLRARARARAPQAAWPDHVSCSRSLGEPRFGAAPNAKATKTRRRRRSFRPSLRL